LVRPDGTVTGTLGGAATDARARDDALKALASGHAEIVTYHLDPEHGESVGSCGATLDIFVEPLRPEPRLLVAGAGYVAQALARLVAPLGWRVTLMDERPEITNVAPLPAGASAQAGEFSALLAPAQPDAASAIVIVTHGHRSDRDALRAALDTPAGYIGMIGSPGKVRQIFRQLLKEHVTAERLARVSAPIGLDLGAETPDEIALAIAAELLAWRRGGSGGALRERAGILARVLAAEGTEGTEESDRGGDAADDDDDAKASGDDATEEVALRASSD
jgi:xanthine dehydrogenase accessory factor